MDAALRIVPAEGAILDEILSATFDIWHEGLARAAYPRYYTGQLATPWGRTHLRRWALVDGGHVLASAKEYDFAATLDGRLIRVFGLGAVFTQPAHRHRGYARVLIERLVARAASDGFDLALLFSEIGTAYYEAVGFTAIPTFELELRVREDPRRGAPAVLVRTGDDRDLPAIADIDAARAARYRFHLNRDRDLVQYGIAKKRLLAGLTPAGERAVHFYVAEEGAAAVAYVLMTVSGSRWILEEAGDRDPSGARIGAILQALVARDPAEQRPTIAGRLPSGLRPPQIEVVGESLAHDATMIRPLSGKGTPIRPLDAGDVYFWRGDLF